MATLIADKMPDAELPLSDFDYELPPGRIAQQPLAQRDQSRLLVVDRGTGEIAADDVFRNLVTYLQPDDLLILNETKVSALRLYGRTVPGDASAEFLLTHRIEEGVWQCLAKPGKRLRPGTTVEVDGGLTVEILDIIDERGARLVRIALDGHDEGTDAAIESVGKTPLPPYIRSDDPNRFRERYQTVYAESPGSAAAPTAGLHFTDELLRQIADYGVDTAKVTLHVGIGTFRPIESADIREHTMHVEEGVIPQSTADKISSAKGRIIAVGTTSVRALESAAIGRRTVRAGEFKTSLYVTPGYEFKIVDALITNFHMPRSTLLVLVSAFAGRDTIIRAYNEAIRRNYRFLSFGDSMFIVGGSLSH